MDWEHTWVLKLLAHIESSHEPSGRVPLSLDIVQSTTRTGFVIVEPIVAGALCGPSVRGATLPHHHYQPLVLNYFHQLISPAPSLPGPAHSVSYPSLLFSIHICLHSNSLFSFSLFFFPSPVLE